MGYTPDDERMLHFVLVPLMASGHMIPMVDLARLLAGRGVVVSVVTTPLNASRIRDVIDRCPSSIRFVTLPFPCGEAGLPEGCENLDTLTSRGMVGNFLRAARMLRQPLERHLRERRPAPSCVISDVDHPWTREISQAFGVPRLVFHGFSAFTLLCQHNLHLHKTHEGVGSEHEPFVLPGLPPHHRIEVTRAQLPPAFNGSPSAADLKDFHDEIREGELTADGVVVNSFKELEDEFVVEFEKATGKKMWTVGPLSLCSKETLDVAERGNRASIDDTRHCLDWLDSMEPRSVVYASFGSMARLSPSQLVEVGLGLESSKHPFVWVIKTKTAGLDAVERWLSEEGFEERTKGRGLLIRGWAPQVLILSHPAVGGFLTHCGWNSTLEGVCAGVPMITWPLFAEQFLNERLLVEVLRIAVGVGVETPTVWMEEEKAGVLVKREEVAEAVERLMDDGDQDAEERRKRARELGERARKAMGEGGSSSMDTTLLIQEVTRTVG